MSTIIVPGLSSIWKIILEKKAEEGSNKCEPSGCELCVWHWFEYTVEGNREYPRIEKPFSFSCSEDSEHDVTRAIIKVLENV